MEVVKPFELEASPKVGDVSDVVLGELVERKDAAKRAARLYADAVELQAKKAGVRKGALNRLVTAQAGDKVGDLVRDTESLAKMLEGR